MKHFALALGFLAASAAAQTPEDTRAQDRIWEAYGNISSRSDYSLSLSGTDGQPGRTDDVRCDLFWSAGADGVPKVDLLAYRNGTLITRIVGDGHTLWSHNLERNEYSAFRYVFPGRDATASLLSALGSTARGFESYAVRVLREFQFVRPSNWRALPAAPPMDMNGQTYDDVDEDILYQLGDPVRREIFYDLQAPTDESPTWNLNAIRFYDATRMGNRKRELNLTLVRGPIEPNHNFTFKPPARARSVRG